MRNIDGIIEKSKEIRNDFIATAKQYEGIEHVQQMYVGLAKEYEIIIKALEEYKKKEGIKGVL